MAFLINESRKAAQGELVQQIYTSGNIETLLVEDPMVIQNRESCKQVIKALRSAQILLSEVQQFHV